MEKDLDKLLINQTRKVKLIRIVLGLLSMVVNLVCLYYLIIFSIAWYNEGTKLYPLIIFVLCMGIYLPVYLLQDKNLDVWIARVLYRKWK